MLQIKSKKKVLDVYIGNFETYTRYSEVADKKKVLNGDYFFKLSKEGDLKKEFGKPWYIHLEIYYTSIMNLAFYC